MTLFQRVSRSFLAFNLALLLMLSITLSFESKPSFAANSRKEPDIAIGKKGKMVSESGKSNKSQSQVDQDAEQLKAKTLAAIDRSIGKSSEKPDKQNKEARESAKDMESEARGAFK